MGYYYNNGNDGRPIDEVVRLAYTKGRDSFDLRISLRTGLAWQICEE